MHNSPRHGFWFLADENSAYGFDIAPQSSSNVSEGSPITFDINTINVPDGFVVYWTVDVIVGDVNVYDFSNGLNGSVTITSNFASITINITSDFVTEGVEGFQVRLHIGSPTGPIIGSSDTITINDNSVTPTYNITPSSFTLYRNNTVSFDVATTGIPANTMLYWDIEGNNVNANDFSDSTISGNFVVNSNGIATFTKTLLPWLIPLNGQSPSLFAETFNIKISTDFQSTGNATLAWTSNTFTIIPPSYDVIANTYSLNEGGTINITVNTVGVPDNATLYWNATGSGVNNLDFTSGSNGSFTISNNAGGFTVSVLPDYTTEGTETFAIDVALATSPSTRVVIASSNTITIGDTSTFDRSGLRSNKVMVVYDPESIHYNQYNDDVNPSSIAASVKNKEESLGRTVTVVSTYADFIARNDLDTFAHIWDVGYDTYITTAAANKFKAYIQNGGAVFFLGENGIFIQRDGTIESIVDDLGGNCNIDNWDPLGSVSATVATEFLLENSSSNITFNRPGRFVSIGTGTAMAYSGYGTHAAVWKTGSLPLASNGAIVSVLDVNFLVGANYDANFTGNLSIVLDKK